MTSRTPQLLVTLTPSGHLAVELPGTMGTRRKIELRPKDAGESLLRILEAQRRDQAEIGLDGAPTTAQIKHWERHSTWPDSRCRFCIAEGRAKPDMGAGLRRKKPVSVLKRPDGVEVRKVAEGTKGTAVLKKNVEDLGL